MVKQAKGQNQKSKYLVNKTRRETENRGNRKTDDHTRKSIRTGKISRLGTRH